MGVTSLLTSAMRSGFTACPFQRHDQRRPARGILPCAAEMQGVRECRPVPQGSEVDPIPLAGMDLREELQVMAHVRPTRGHTVWMRSGEAAARGIRYPASQG